MENTVVSSVLRDARVARVRERGAWKAGSTFGLALIGSGLGLLLVAILIAGADPSGLGFVLPMLAIVMGITYLVRRHGLWAQGIAAAGAVALAGMLVPVLPHAAFDSFFDLVPVMLCLAGVVAILGSAGADLARREPTARTPAVLVASGITVVSVIAFVGLASGIATFTGQETLTAAEREGRLPVAMTDSAFKPKTIVVTEGEDVRIALKNGDPVIHDLRIPDLDLKFSVKPGSEKAFEFTAPSAGTYKFDCSLHPNMKGVLEVLSK